jgi:hypothetical protein
MEEEQEPLNIAVNIVGHDVATNTIILQLPSGTIVPATVARAYFNRSIIPLLKDAPKQATQSTPEAKAEIKAVIQEATQIAKEVQAEADDMWWDVDGMFQEIRWHAKKNGRSIVLDERDIQPPRIAFKCKTTNKSWSIDVKCLNEYCDKLFNSPDPASQSKGFQLRKCIGTHEGKERLVESLNNAIK